MKEHFSGKAVGYDDAIYGLIDGEHFYIHGMKEPDFAMVLITIYCTLGRSGNEIKWCVNGEAVQFKYPEIVQNHYTYRHAVDDSNNRRQSPFSIE